FLEAFPADFRRGVAGSRDEAPLGLRKLPLGAAQTGFLMTHVVMALPWVASPPPMNLTASERPREEQTRRNSETRFELDRHLPSLTRCLQDQAAAARKLRMVLRGCSDGHHGFAGRQGRRSRVDSVLIDGTDGGIDA